MVDASIIPKTGGNVFRRALESAPGSVLIPQIRRHFVKSDYTKSSPTTGDGGMLSDLELNRRRGVPYALILGGGTATMAGCWLDSTGLVDGSTGSKATRCT
jgi:hypothetical protein